MLPYIQGTTSKLTSFVLNVLHGVLQVLGDEDVIVHSIHTTPFCSVVGDSANGTDLIQAQVPPGGLAWQLQHLMIQSCVPAKHMAYQMLLGFGANHKAHGMGGFLGGNFLFKNCSLFTVTYLVSLHTIIWLQQSTVNVYTMVEIWKAV